MKNIVFIDLETVRQHDCFETLKLSEKESFYNKMNALKKSVETPVAELYREKGGILAEYGKIIVIGLGYFTQNGKETYLKTKVIYSDNEKELLTAFVKLFEKSKQITFCAHNGYEFDYPYLCRRLLINQIPLPVFLQLQRKKPWNHPHIDTMDLWRFGDHKNYTSLDTLATAFNIPTSKEVMKGSDVGQVYYEEKNIKKIAQYCQEDIIVLARIYQALQQEDIIEDRYIIRDEKIKELILDHQETLV